MVEMCLLCAWLMFGGIYAAKHRPRNKKEGNLTELETSCRELDF